MVLKNLFRRTVAQPSAAETLYGKIVEKARDPLFYLRLGVPDTVDGRFDMVVIHAMLVMRRLRTAGEPARQVSQDLFDLMFMDMDQSLREMGVGDLSVGKHVKKMAKAFYGRASSYEEGLDAKDGGTALNAALTQSLYNRDGAATAYVDAMAKYLVRADQHLQAQNVEHVAAGNVRLDVPVLAE